MKTVGFCVRVGLAALGLIPGAARGQGVPASGVVPLRHATSWVGNSFGGDGGPNGEGFWVQNAADEIEVTPDGTVFAGVPWDEAGRCAGLYKDGRVNRVLLKERDGRPGKDTAWGWGTANAAVAAGGEFLYVASLGKRLLRFRWTPGDLESARYDLGVDLGGEAVGLAARGDALAVVYKDAVEFRDAAGLATAGRFALADARDAAFAPDGSLWVLAGSALRRVSREGRELVGPVEGLGRPTAVSVDPKGRLIVCDDGPRQQVLVFEGADRPRLVATFGDEGGLRSGTPGLAAPAKLFGLRGAGADASGNLYVALGFSGQPAGNLVLRSFDPSGKPRWELSSTAFVDTFGFDPDSDGASVYSRTAVFDLDLSRAGPGAESRLKAFTFDPADDPADERAKFGCSAVVRNLQGRRLLYTIGQYGGGYRLFTFDGPGGLVARPAGRITAEGETWAWDVDVDGGVWHGDAPGRTVRRYPFRGWLADGKPDFDRDHPDSRPWPDDFALVRRVIYEKSTDALYLFGYLKGQEVDSWGVVGPAARRVDGWLKGPKADRWTLRGLPVNPKGSDKGGPLSPSSVDIAGDYLFVGMVKPEDGRQPTHVLRLSDGGYVGTLLPGPEVGGQAGWLDMPYALQALKRRDGEYLVLVEEDFRGKNLLYRWRPADPAPR